MRSGAVCGRVGALKPLTRAQSRLRAAQRQAARRRGPYDPQTKTHREPSNRWQRANARVGRIHAKVAAIRRMRSTRPPLRRPPATRLSRSSSCRPRTWPGAAGGVNTVSTGPRGCRGRADSYAARLQEHLVWHHAGDRATMLPLDTAVFAVWGENQAPPARSRVSIPKWMPADRARSECGDQPRPPRRPHYWGNGDRYRQ